MVNQASVARTLALFVSLLALAAAVDVYPHDDESYVQLPPGNEEIGTVNLTTPFLLFQQSYTQIKVNCGVLLYGVWLACISTSK